MRAATPRFLREWQWKWHSGKVVGLTLRLPRYCSRIIFVRVEFGIPSLLCVQCVLSDYSNVTSAVEKRDVIGNLYIDEKKKRKFQSLEFQRRKKIVLFIQISYYSYLDFFVCVIVIYLLYFSTNVFMFNRAGFVFGLLLQSRDFH